jgi:XTP/dITP diphosphohydrolase
VQDSQKIKLVFATNNKHKFREIKLSLSDEIDLISLADLNYTEEIPEDQDTIEGNAAQKAYYIYHKLGLNCFADDTGLLIDALDGEPGVLSARYAGQNCTFEDNINKVLLNMAGKSNRKASFLTVIALVENGILNTFRGEIKGYITHEKQGTDGFGYDPIFQPAGFNKTFAEMSLAEKNSISHRAIAIKALVAYLSDQHDKTVKT